MKASVVPVFTAAGNEAKQLKEGILYKRFFMVEQDYALKIAKGDIDLSKTEFRVWYALLSHAEKGNYVYHKRSFMAAEIGMAVAHFHTAVRGLKSHDMIVEAPDRGKGNSLMLSPHHVWKGSGSEQRMAIRQYTSHARKAAKLASERAMKEMGDE